jgi:hypothetical protein
VGDRTWFFVDFAQALCRDTRGPRWLCIDEAHNFAPRGKIMDPQAGQMLHWANRLASKAKCDVAACRREQEEVQSHDRTDRRTERNQRGHGEAGGESALEASPLNSLEKGIHC